jgi:hypothetical protein
VGGAVALAIGGAAVATALALRVFPEHRDFLTDELGPLEVASAIVLALALVTGLATFRRARPVSDLLWAVPGLAAFFLLEELGWGAEITNLEYPEVGDVTVDSVHDVLSLLVELTQYTGVVIVLPAAGAAAALTSFFLRHRSSLAAPFHEILRTAPLRLCALSFLIATAAGIIDAAQIAGVASDDTTPVEEVLELAAAILLLAASTLLSSGK